MTPPEFADLGSVEELRATAADLAPFEKEYIRKDGSRVPVLAARATFDEARGDGVAFVIDITERKRAEQALLESENRLRLALSGAKAAAWQWNVVTNELIWSRECWLLYGRDPERDLARYELWRECLHPEDLEPTERLLRHVLDRRLPEYRTEYRVIRPNGDMRWLAALGEMEFSADGAPLRLSGINIDITEQKRAKEETEEILASIADGFYALDRDWRFNYFNPGAERLLGKKRDDVVGLSIFEVFPLLRGSPLHANFRKAMTVRQPLAFRCWGPTLKRWAAFNVYPTREGGVSVHFRDITEEKAVEVELVQAKAEAERANVAKSKFLAAASHDLRQPVQSLTLAAERHRTARRGQAKGRAIWSKWPRRRWRA